MNPHPAPFRETLPSDAAVLREHFASATRDPNAFGHAFYAGVFERAPAVRALFPSDIDALQEKLVRTLRVLMKGLDQPDAAQVQLQLLGARHVGFGAQPAHYEVVGAALIDTISRLGEAPLDADGRERWTRFLNWVAGCMLEGAERATRRATPAVGQDRPTVPLPLPRVDPPADRH